METVATLGRVRFVNDSKATNADAARQALSSYPRSFWILGGQAKTGGIESLEDLFGRVAKAYVIGEAAPAFAQTLKGKATVAESGTLDAAVAQAYADASATGQDAIVLLSPAAASFDQYADFEARGEAFRAAVQRLAHAARGPHEAPFRSKGASRMTAATPNSSPTATHAFARSDRSAIGVWWWTVDRWMLASSPC